MQRRLSDTPTGGGKGKIKVAVTVPKSKAKKLGKVKKATVAYGFTKNSKKFEAKKVQAKVTKQKKIRFSVPDADNVIDLDNPQEYILYVFTFKIKEYARTVNIDAGEQTSPSFSYITVRLGSKSNWSKLTLINPLCSGCSYNSGTYWSECNHCGKYWESKISILVTDSLAYKHMGDSFSNGCDTYVPVSVFK